MNQKKLNFKLDKNKKGRPQKHKDSNRSGGRNWKFKSYKVIETDQGLKCIKSKMDTEEWANQALVLAIATSNKQHSVPGNQDIF